MSFYIIASADLKKSQTLHKVHKLSFSNKTSKILHAFSKRKKKKMFWKYFYREKLVFYNKMQHILSYMDQLAKY